MTARQLAPSTGRHEDDGKQRLPLLASAQYHTISVVLAILERRVLFGLMGLVLGVCVCVLTSYLIRAVSCLILGL